MADVNNLGERFSAQFRGLNGRHPGLWPLLPRAACCIGVLVAVIAAGWFLYWDGQMQALEEGAIQEAKLKDEYKLKLQQAVNLPGLRKQKVQVGEYVATLEKQLPSKAEMDALLQDISQAGQGRGLQFELFKPGQVLVKEYYAELPIDIRITGSYHDIGAFSSDIANLPRIVTINNVTLAAGRDSTTLSMDAVAKTFRYLDKDEVSAQRKASAEKKVVKK
ncbi:MAG: pilO [Paucimonas sp.]|nr:pilO [Paucimonas sp.]